MFIDGALEVVVVVRPPAKINDHPLSCFKVQQLEYHQMVLLKMAQYLLNGLQIRHYGWPHGVIVRRAGQDRHAQVSDRENEFKAA